MSEHEISEEELKTNRGDAAALMLAGVDNPDAFDQAMRHLSPFEAARMCAAAIVVGRDVVKLCEKYDDHDPPVTPRRAIEAIISACRE